MLEIDKTYKIARKIGQIIIKTNNKIMVNIAHKLSYHNAHTGVKIMLCDTRLVKGSQNLNF